MVYLVNKYLTMRKIFSLFIVNLLFLSVNAQIADSCYFIQFDLANRWIWRGVSYSETPVIQPSLGYTKDKLKLLIWGSYPFERRAYSEIDFTVEYQLTKKLKIGLTDFFAINDSIGARYKFFNLKRKTTSHMLDVYAIFTPSEKIPLSLLYSFWFWGADRKEITKEQNLSSYFEVKYEKRYTSFDASAFAGMTLGDGFYASRPAVVNVGIGLAKPITFGKSVSIPAKVEFILNPETQNVYLNAIITIK